MLDATVDVDEGFVGTAFAASLAIYLFVRSATWIWSFGVPDVSEGTFAAALAMALSPRSETLIWSFGTGAADEGTLAASFAKV